MDSLPYELMAVEFLILIVGLIVMYEQMPKKRLPPPPDDIIEESPKIIDIQERAHRIIDVQEKTNKIIDSEESFPDFDFSKPSDQLNLPESAQRLQTLVQARSEFRKQLAGATRVLEKLDYEIKLAYDRMEELKKNPRLIEAS